MPAGEGEQPESTPSPVSSSSSPRSPAPDTPPQDVHSLSLPLVIPECIATSHELTRFPQLAGYREANISANAVATAAEEPSEDDILATDGLMRAGVSHPRTTNKQFPAALPVEAGIVHKSLSRSQGMPYIVKQLKAAAEKERKAAEKERKAAEKERKAAEKERKAAKQEREAAEQERNLARISRRIAEAKNKNRACVITEQPFQAVVSFPDGASPPIVVTSLAHAWSLPIQDLQRVCRFYLSDEGVPDLLSRQTLVAILMQQLGADG